MDDQAPEAGRELLGKSMGARSAAPRGRRRGRPFGNIVRKVFSPTRHADVSSGPRDERARGSGSNANCLVLPGLRASHRRASQALSLLRARTADAGLRAEDHVQRQSLQNESRARERQQLWPAGDGVMRPSAGSRRTATCCSWPGWTGAIWVNRVASMDSGKSENQPHPARPACTRGHGALSLPHPEGDPDLCEPGGRRRHLRHREDERTGV